MNESLLLIIRARANPLSLVSPRSVFRKDRGFLANSARHDRSFGEARVKLLESSFDLLYLLARIALGEVYDRRIILVS